MVEFAPVGDDLYRRGFAGDTLNTCWHMARILGDHAQVSYFTRVGRDPFSAHLIEFMANIGIEVGKITRDSIRSIGHYVTNLSGAERSFSYWRDTSAAQCLADDLGALVEATENMGLIHVSGITLAVIDGTGRRTLTLALQAARSEGATV